MLGPRASRERPRPAPFPAARPRARPQLGLRPGARALTARQVQDRGEQQADAAAAARGGSHGARELAAVAGRRRRWQRERGRRVPSPWAQARSCLRPPAATVAGSVGRRGGAPMPPWPGRRARLGSGFAGRRDPRARGVLRSRRGSQLPDSQAARGAHRGPESKRLQRRSLEPNRALSASRSPLSAARAPPSPRPPFRPSPSPRPPVAALSAVLYRLFFNPFWAVRPSSAKPIYCREKESSPPPRPPPPPPRLPPLSSPQAPPPSLTTRLLPSAS